MSELQSVIRTRPEPPPGIEGLAELAARLGVKPWTGLGANVLLGARDGQHYALIDLMSAFLDRLDKALPADPAKGQADG